MNQASTDVEPGPVNAHNLGEVLRISDRLVVLDNGRKIAEGKPETVMRMPHVRAAYVGKEETDAAA